MSSSEQDHSPPQQQQQQSKVDCSPKKYMPTSTPQTKKTASYTYWVDEKNKSRELPPEQRPQKIEAPINSNQPADNGRSQWNTAGTWENKKISVGDVEKQYTKKLSQWLSTVCPQAKVSMVSLNGQCELLFTRNKKALTYQLTGKVEFQKTLPSLKEEQTQAQKQKSQPENNNDSDSQELSGDQKESLKNNKAKSITSKAKKFSIEITELTDSGERDYSMKADTGQDKKWIGGQANKALAILEDILKAYK